MGSLLEATKNTRSIVPNTLRCIRSDVPINLITPDERYIREFIAWLS